MKRNATTGRGLRAPTSHGWGRSQKYHDRPRTLYALLFPSGHAYIGQSVDVVKREQQHRRPAGGWCGQPFRCVVLETRPCTELEAADLEHAWRLKAARNGWRIYAKPPCMVVDPQRQATLKHSSLAVMRSWPWQHSRTKTRRLVAGVVIVLVLVVLLRQLL